MTLKGRDGGRDRNINLGRLALELLLALIPYNSGDSETKKQGRSH